MSTGHFTVRPLAEAMETESRSCVQSRCGSRPARAWPRDGGNGIFHVLSAHTALWSSLSPPTPPATV